ncbi:DHA2 family efflux MFS transporter permease subunit [Chitinimonas sp.]|uniref:DHA2 family efflux MFS transporter permease subunit n=1 Tax=Chitinimonas sp. TaxID=1934313 RepID=UPI002F91C565
MSATPSNDIPLPALKGAQLVGAGLLLAAANFIAVLDTTIANVSVPTISGALGASTSQGTYVITSYAVAEAITVPLTGWLAGRFGAVRVFVTSMLMFGLFSALCGMANSLEMLVLFRVLQGLAGGPLMPMSQTLLLRIFPKEKAAAATGLWAMTTLIAPIMGPILGGVICDNMHWSFIFLINVPVAVLCAWRGWSLLKQYETKLAKVSIDVVGLVLLIVWVAALQLMLDEGKDKDWFNSPEIVGLAIVAAIGFAAFMIWELTEKHPVVNLRVFRHRGYSASVLTICLAFGAFFGATVLTPLWLQSYMGYTSTWAGYTTAVSGILAVLAAPLAANMSARFDPRPLVFFGVLWLGMVTLFRTQSNLDMTQWQIALPLLFQGLGMPFFFVPLTGLALASVDEEETASAAGLMSFCRTVSGAFATSLVNTSWESKTTYNRAELAGLTDRTGEVSTLLSQNGYGLEQARGTIDQMVQAQSVMLATNQIFLIAGCAFVLAAIAIWLAPKPTRVADTSAAH